MDAKKVGRFAVMPVMTGFFIMGFVDIVGVATNYIKNDFTGMSDTVSGLVSLSCFLWFLLLSVPTGMLMNKIGRKNTVLLSFAVTVIAMAVPAVSYSFVSVILAFTLLGIGNTLLQVSLNPLVINVVSGDKLTGSLTLGQFIKAISSFLGPIIVAAVAGSFMHWRLVFPIYALISFLAMIWLWATPIEEKKFTDKISLGRTFSLLKDKYILAFFIGILVLVGVDVGMNVTFPKVLMERCSFTLEKAGMGNSVYFLARTVGAFAGGLLLMKLPEGKFFVVSVSIAIAGLAGMIFATDAVLLFVSVVIFGLGYANLFSILMSLSMKREPERANEVSSLLIVGVSGGAVVPVALGAVSDGFGSQGAALVALGILWLYMLFIMKPVITTSASTRS